MRARYWTMAIVSVLAMYVLSWTFRKDLGFVHPMANLRYFYFGNSPDSTSDNALYLFYYPLYAAHLGFQGDPEIHGRSAVHWSDRRDAKP